jgi:heat shock protein HslJ
VADRALAGTDWRVVATAGSTAAPTTGPTAAPTAGSPAAAPSNTPALRFDAGRVTGSDGCNRLMGPYAADGAALTLGPLAGTRMACAQGMAEAEAFRAALGRTATHRIVGDVLELQDAQGATLLRLQARP